MQELGCQLAASSSRHPRYDDEAWAVAGDAGDDVRGGGDGLSGGVPGPCTAAEDEDGEDGTASVVAGTDEEDGSDDDGFLTGDGGAGEEGAADEETEDGVEMEQCCADNDATCCSNSGFVQTFAGEKEGRRKRCADGARVLSSSSASEPKAGLL
jgi:hypothetical protein